MAYLDSVYYTRKFYSDNDITHVCLNFPPGIYYITDVFVHQGSRTQQLFFTTSGVQQPDVNVSLDYASTDLTAFTINNNEEFFFSFYVRGDFPINEFEGLYTDGDSEEVILGSGDIIGGNTIVVDGNTVIILNPSNPGGNSPITVIVGDTSGGSYASEGGPSVLADQEFASSVTPWRLVAWTESLSYHDGTPEYTDGGVVISYTRVDGSRTASQSLMPTTPIGAIVFYPNKSFVMDFTIKRKTTPAGSTIALGSACHWWAGTFYSETKGSRTVGEIGYFRLIGNYNSSTEQFTIQYFVYDESTLTYRDITNAYSTDPIFTLDGFTCDGLAEYDDIDMEYIVQSVTITPADAFVSYSNYPIAFVSVGRIFLPRLSVVASATRFLGSNQGHIALTSLTMENYQSLNDRADVAMPTLVGDGTAWFAFGSMVLPIFEVGAGDAEWCEAVLPALTCSATAAYAYGSCFLATTMEAVSFIQGVPNAISDSLKPMILLEGNQEIINIAESLFWGM